MAFLSTPSIEWLYSGVAMNSASARRIASLRTTNRLGKTLGLDIRVVERDWCDVERLDRHPIRRQFLRRAEQGSIVRTDPQAAGPAQDLELFVQLLIHDITSAAVLVRTHRCLAITSGLLQPEFR
jgi:hypothetical protein